MGYRTFFQNEDCSPKFAQVMVSFILMCQNWIMAALVGIKEINMTSERWTKKRQNFIKE